MRTELPPISGITRRWLYLTLAGLVAIAVAWTAVRVRAALTPILASLVLAYILNPLVSWAERRGLDRLPAVVAIYCAAAVLVAAAALFLTKVAFDQVEALRRDLPRYLLAAQDLVTEPRAGPSAVGVQLWERLVRFATEHGLALAEAVAAAFLSAAGSGLALLTLLVLVPAYTFVFLWRFDWLVVTVRDYLPLAWRDTIIRIVNIADRSIANFFRGRLLVCLAVALSTAVGWTLAGVPFGAWLGLLAGILNLIPFMSLLTLPLALGLRYLAAFQAGADWVVPVLLTAAVYVAVQALESFVLSPLIESRSSGLHPLTVVAALMIGQECGGLVGLLLAIPAASTLKAVAAEFLLPWIRRLAVASPPAEPVRQSEGSAHEAQRQNDC